MLLRNTISIERNKTSLLLKATRKQPELKRKDGSRRKSLLTRQSLKIRKETKRKSLLIRMMV